MTVLSVAVNRKPSSAGLQSVTVNTPCEPYRMCLFKWGVSSACSGRYVFWGKAIKQAMFIFGFFLVESAPFGGSLLPAHLSLSLRALLLSLLKLAYQFLYIKCLSCGFLWGCRAGDKEMGKIIVFVSQALLILLEKKAMNIWQAFILPFLRHSLKVSCSLHLPDKIWLEAHKIWIWTQVSMLKNNINKSRMESEHLLKTIRPKRKAWNKAVSYHSKSVALGLLTWVHFYCPVLWSQIFFLL